MARKLYEVADQVARDHAQARDAVRVTWNALRREQIDAKLSAVPVARLFKEASVSRAVQEVEAAGARTARDVLDAGVPGLGHMGMDRSSAEHAHTAASSLRTVGVDIPWPPQTARELRIDANGTVPGGRWVNVRGVAATVMQSARNSGLRRHRR